VNSSIPRPPSTAFTIDLRPPLAAFQGRLLQPLLLIQGRHQQRFKAASYSLLLLIQGQHKLSRPPPTAFTIDSRLPLAAFQGCLLQPLLFQGRLLQPLVTCQINKSFLARKVLQVMVHFNNYIAGLNNVEIREENVQDVLTNLLHGCV
jgi:hypothetical protein